MYTQFQIVTTTSVPSLDMSIKDFTISFLNAMLMNESAIKSEDYQLLHHIDELKRYLDEMLTAKDELKALMPKWVNVSLIYAECESAIACMDICLKDIKKFIKNAETRYKPITSL